MGCVGFPVVGAVMDTLRARYCRGGGLMNARREFLARAGEGGGKPADAAAGDYDGLRVARRAHRQIIRSAPRASMWFAPRAQRRASCGRSDEAAASAVPRTEAEALLQKLRQPALQVAFLA